MPLILGPAGQLARQSAYAREDEFESDVVHLADCIFGPSVYVDVKRRVGDDIATIPDGYLGAFGDGVQEIGEPEYRQLSRRSHDSAKLSAGHHTSALLYRLAIAMTVLFVVNIPAA
jgi:hypothetical protein